MCGVTEPLSVHHISKHPRDDVEANCVMLCGSGTTGCHGLIEARDKETTRMLGQYISESRPDFITYIYERKGATATAWLQINLLVDSPGES